MLDLSNKQGAHGLKWQFKNYFDHVKIKIKGMGPGASKTLKSCVLPPSPDISSNAKCTVEITILYTHLGFTNDSQ